MHLAAALRALYILPGDVGEPRRGRRGDGDDDSHRAKLVPLDSASEVTIGVDLKKEHSSSKENGTLDARVIHACVTRWLPISSSALP